MTQLNQLMNRSLQTPIEILNPKQVLEQQALMKSKSISKEHPRLETIRNLQESNKAKVNWLKNKRYHNLVWVWIMPLFKTVM